MASAQETYRVIDNDKLPEGALGFEAFGFDERGHLVGFQEGEHKTIQKLGELLVATWMKDGSIEELAPVSEESDAMQHRITELEGQLEKERLDHKRELEEKENKIAELSAKVDSLAESIDSLTRKLKEHKLISDEEAADIKQPTATRDETETTTQPTSEPDKEPKKETPQERVVRLRAELAEAEKEAGQDTTTEVPQAEEVTETTTVSTPENEQPASLNRRQRARLLMNNAAMYPFTRRVTTSTEYDDSGRVVAVEERRRGGGPIVLAAVAGAVAWELLEHYVFHWGHHAKGYYSHQPNGSLDMDKLPSPIPGNTASGGHHLDLYDSAAPNPKTAIYDPENLKLVGKPGHESLIDTRTNTTLVRHVGWDSQGKLDYGTKHILKRHGYSLTDAWYKGRRATLVS